MWEVRKITLKYKLILQIGERKWKADDFHHWMPISRLLFIRGRFYWSFLLRITTKRSGIEVIYDRDCLCYRLTDWIYAIMRGLVAPYPQSHFSVLFAICRHNPLYICMYVCVVSVCLNPTIPSHSSHLWALPLSLSSLPQSTQSTTSPSPFLYSFSSTYLQLTFVICVCESTKQSKSRRLDRGQQNCSLFHSLLLT